MIWASSSGDHLLCFFAGDPNVVGGIAARPVEPGGRWASCTKVGNGGSLEGTIKVVVSGAESVGNC